jgi:hypothetical protein
LQVLSVSRDVVLHIFNGYDRFSVPPPNSFGPK